jgi:hypothetical protein
VEVVPAHNGAYAVVVAIPVPPFATVNGKLGNDKTPSILLFPVKFPAPFMLRDVDMHDLMYFIILF